MKDIKKLVNQNEELKETNTRLSENFKNLRIRLLNEVESIDNILTKQPFTIFQTEEYYKAERTVKMKLSSLIHNIIKGRWDLDENGDIIERLEKQEEKI